MTRSREDTKAQGKTDYARRLKVLIYLLEAGFATVSELGKKCGGDISSIRLDIADLQKRCNFVKALSDDLVISLTPTFANKKLIDRLETNLEAKWRVAQKAVELIEERDCVFLSGGATCFLLALEIARTGKRGISVVSGTLYNQQFLRRVHQVRILSGRVARDSAVVQCEADDSSLAEYHINKSFLGVEGLSRDAGAFCVQPNMALQQAACLAASDRVVFLTDHSEMGKSFPEGKFITFEELEKAGREYLIISDRNVTGQDEMTRFEEEVKKFKGRVMLV